MHKIINVGIIGCGEASQILHIPTLRELTDRFRIKALCDVSRTVVQALGKLVPDAEVYHDSSSLLDDASVDAVLIANPNALHAPTAIEAMRKGKHVLIEKPMCMTLSEADALAEVQATTGMTVQIGYMRRHAPAFEEAVQIIAGVRDTINFARVHAIIGPNSSFVDPTSVVIRGQDINRSVKDQNDRETNAKLVEAIGTSEGPRAQVYNLLLGLSSHDISAMRELIGMPKRLLSASFRRGGLFINASFDYGDFICQFETGIDSVARFDAHLEVFTQDKIVRVDYDTPYIRHQPAVLTVTEPDTRFGVKTSVSHKTRGDAFVLEWTRFHEAVVNGSPVKTTIADAKQDLVIFQQMMKEI